MLRKINLIFLNFPLKYFVRLNPNGSLDSSFNMGSGVNSAIFELAVQPGGRILIAGAFTSYNNSNANLIARLFTFKATVAPPQSSGQVTFTLGTTTVTAMLTNGVANYVTNTLVAGVYTLTAAYGGDTIYAPSVSAVYTQVVQVPCNPLVVTSGSDDGHATTCGTFSYALLSASSGTTITFALGVTNTISFSGSLTPTVPVGVAIDDGVGGIVLAGNRVDGDGLRLGGLTLSTI